MNARHVLEWMRYLNAKPHFNSSRPTQLVFYADIHVYIKILEKPAFILRIFSLDNMFLLSVIMLIRWIRTLFGNNKVANSRIGFYTEQCIVVCLGKTLHAYIPISGPSNLPLVVARSDQRLHNVSNLMLVW